MRDRLNVLSREHPVLAALVYGWSFACLMALFRLVVDDDDATLTHFLGSLVVSPLTFGAFMVWVERRGQTRA